MKSGTVLNYAPGKGSVEILEIEKPSIEPEYVVLEVVNAVKVPLQAVGGLRLEQGIQCPNTVHRSSFSAHRSPSMPMPSRRRMEISKLPCA